MSRSHGEGLRPPLRTSLRPAPPDQLAWAMATSAWTRCARWSTRPPPNRTAIWPVRPASSRCASWPRWPGPTRDPHRPRTRSTTTSDRSASTTWCRTVTAQLPPTSYAEVKACLEARAKRLPSDGETPLDQRLADAFMELVRTSGRRSATDPRGYTVLAHVPLDVLTDPDLDPLWRARRRRPDLGRHGPRVALRRHVDRRGRRRQGPHHVRGAGERLATDAQRRELAGATGTAASPAAPTRSSSSRTTCTSGSRRQDRSARIWPCSARTTITSSTRSSGV